jgi:Laminin B (Domain IV)/PEP-CTERM motif
MIKNYTVKFATVAATLFAIAATTSAAAISTFDTDAENWSVVSFTNPNGGDFSVMSTNAPTYNATGGNPGGFISTVDPDNGDFMFSAPGKFLGDQSGAGSLSYDLTYPTGNLDYKPVDIMLTSASTRLLWISNPTLAPGAGFTHVDIGLAPSANWHLGTTAGPTPAAADFQATLSGLTGLFISGEYTVGLIETPGLDNVKLRVPEPATMILAVIGLAALTAMVRNRKQ